MKFLNVFVLIFFTALSCAAQAQDYTSTNTKALKAYENATNAFDNRSYDLALAYIEEAIKRDGTFIEAYLLRFEIYAEQDDLVNAEFALEDAFAIDPDFYRHGWFFLAEIEMSQGKYIEAGPHYKKYLSYSNLKPEMVQKAELQMKNCDFAIVATQKPVEFDPTNMGEAINTPAAEYYPSVSADGSSFIFTRLVEDARSYGGKNENFYRSTNRDGTWFPAIPMNEVNTEYNEGAPTISADGRFLVFTACELMGEYGEGRTGFGSCDLFISENIGGEWQKPVNMGEPINSQYWETQPSLSADGNTLYFIKGLPSREGVRQQDIYESRKRSDGTWTRPKKLSNVINTPYTEESVQIHPDGKTLYFSSAGHTGMGGLDLYVSRKNSKGNWKKPVNLGYPINTYKDENSLLVSPDGQLAYFASNREGGMGDLDLYQFPLYKAVRPIPVTYAKGRVRDAETGDPVLAEIRITDLNNRNYKKKFYSDLLDGQFLVALNSGDQYSATVIAEGYMLYSNSFTVPKKIEKDGFAVDVSLHRIEAGARVVLENIYFDTDSDSLTQHSIPELRELGAFLENHPEIVVEISGHTDNTGDAAYNKDLSLRRAQAVQTYLLQRREIEADRIVVKGYGSEQPIADNDTEEGKAQNRRTEVKIVSVDQ